MDQTDQDKRIVSVRHISKVEIDGRTGIYHDLPVSAAVVVDNSEFELITKFVSFIRGRERGTFTAKIITNNGRRHVKLDLADEDMIELIPIVEIRL